MGAGDQVAADSYARGESEPALLEVTIGANLAATVARVPDHEALIDVAAGLRWTYSQFHAAVRALATGLLGAGIGPGDRLGIWSPNCAQWVLVQYAAAEIGAVLVNLNPAYRAHELRYALTQSSPAMVIAARAFKSSDYTAVLAQVAPQCPDLREVVHFESAQIGRAHV